MPAKFVIGTDGAVSVHGIPHDHLEVERQGHEDQTGQGGRRASDHQEEVVPLVRSVGIGRGHYAGWHKRRSTGR